MEKKLRKRVSGLSALMLLVLLPTQIAARDFTYKDIVYTVLNESAKTVATKEGFSPSSYNPNHIKPGNVVSGTLVLDEIVYDGDTPYSLTRIGFLAFYGCSGLTSVTIPNSVTSIGSDAFYGCSGLTSVTIPNSVTSIGGSAFYGCSGLTSVTIPNSVTSIVGSAFYGCSGLTSVTIPNSVTSIGSDAFYGCSGLTSVTIPNLVTSIGNNAFARCENLQSVYMSNNILPSIGNSSFPSSTKLYVPDGCIEAYKAKWADYADNIDGFFRAGLVHEFKYGDILYSVTDAEEMTVSVKKYISSSDSQPTTMSVNAVGNMVDIPSKVEYLFTEFTVTGIGENSFANSGNIHSVKIPETVTFIEAGAFSGCPLEEVRVDNPVPPVCDSAAFDNTSFDALLRYPGESQDAYFTADVWKNFGNNSGYYNVGTEFIYDGILYVITETDKFVETKAGSVASGKLIIPDTVTFDNFDYTVRSIGDESFAESPELTELIVPDNIMTVGVGAFRNCPKLSKLTIEKGDSVINFEGDVFGTSPVATVEVNRNWTNGEAGLLAQEKTLEKLTSLTFGSDMTAIPDYAFANATKFNALDIPANIKTIGAHAFRGATAARGTLEFKYGLISIGDESFAESPDLTELIIPGSVVTVGVGAFRDCPKLSKLTIEKGDFVINFEGDVFGTSPVATVEVNRNWTNGEAGLLAQEATLKKLTLLTIGKDLTAIPDYAFANIKQLKTLDIPANIETIGAHAFQGATAVRGALEFKDGLISIGDSAFVGMRVSSITFPKTLESIGANAFANCAALTGIELPESLKTLGESAFKSDNRVKSLVVNGNTNIAALGFSGCTALESVEFKNGGSVGEKGFELCDKIKTLNFVGHLSSIGKKAFDIPLVEKLDITVDAIADTAFINCSALTSLNVRGNGGIGTMAIGGAALLTEAAIDMPTIDAYVIKGADKLSNLVLGDSVRIIKNSAFYGHTELTDVTFGKGLNQIGDYAFDKTNLSAIIFPTVENPSADDMLTFGRRPFDYALGADVVIDFGNKPATVNDGFGSANNKQKNLTIKKLDLGGVNFHESIPPFRVESNGEILIDSMYVRPATSMIRMSDKSTVSKTWKTRIKHLVVDNSKEQLRFEGSDIYVHSGVINRPSRYSNSLKVYSIEGSRPSFTFGVEGEYPMTLDGWFLCPYTSDEIDLHIGHLVKSINREVVGSQINSHLNLTIEEGVEEINKLLGSRISSIENVVLPSSLKKYNFGAINYAKVGSITFKESDTPLEFTGAGANMTNVKEVQINRPITDESAHFLMESCPNVEMAIFGPKAKKVADGLFKGCTTLKQAILDDEVAEIGETAFMGCTGLTTLSLSENVTAIGSNAYSGCENIERIVARSLVPPEGDAGFDEYVQMNVPLYVQESVVDDYMDSDLFWLFDNINPYGDKVASEIEVVPVDPEDPDYGIDEDFEVGDIFSFLKNLWLKHIYGHITSHKANVARRTVSRAAAADGEAAPEFYWMSTDPSVATVNQQGEMTVLRKAPVEIRAYALDGSDKYASFAVNPPVLPGDLNRDNVLNGQDVNILINYIVAPGGTTVKLSVGDLNGDGEINGQDCNILIGKCVNNE